MWEAWQTCHKHLHWHEGRNALAHDNMHVACERQCHAVTQSLLRWCCQLPPANEISDYWRWSWCERIFCWKETLERTVPATRSTSYLSIQSVRLVLPHKYRCRMFSVFYCVWPLRFCHLDWSECGMRTQTETTRQSRTRNSKPQKAALPSFQGQCKEATSSWCSAILVT